MNGPINLFNLLLITGPTNQNTFLGYTSRNKTNTRIIDSIKKRKTSIFLQYHHVQIFLRPYQLSFVEKKKKWLKLFAEIYPLMRLGTRGFIPTYPLHACMTWCLINNRKRFKISSHAGKKTVPFSFVAYDFTLSQITLTRKRYQK